MGYKECSHQELPHNKEHKGSSHKPTTVGASRGTNDRKGRGYLSPIPYLVPSQTTNLFLFLASLTSSLSNQIKLIQRVKDLSSPPATPMSPAPSSEAKSGRINGPGIHTMTFRAYRRGSSYHCLKGYLPLMSIITTPEAPHCHLKVTPLHPNCLATDQGIG